MAAYRKIHLFDSLGERESALVAPGSEPVVADLAGVRTGFATCYDIRFPELARALVARGAELIVVPGAWAAGLFKEEHWVTLVRARAIENTVWVAAAGQVPDPASPPTRAPTGVGRSMLVDPMGTVRADLGLWPQVTVAELDSALTARVRTVLPCLEHRRDDVFGPADPARPAPPPARPRAAGQPGQRTRARHRTGRCPVPVAAEPTPVSTSARHAQARDLLSARHADPSSARPGRVPGEPVR